MQLPPKGFTVEKLRNCADLIPFKKLKNGTSISRYASEIAGKPVIVTVRMYGDVFDGGEMCVNFPKSAGWTRQEVEQQLEGSWYGGPGETYEREELLTENRGRYVVRQDFGMDC